MKETKSIVFCLQKSLQLGKFRLRDLLDEMKPVVLGRIEFENPRKLMKTRISFESATAQSHLHYIKIYNLRFLTQGTKSTLHLS